MSETPLIIVPLTGSDRFSQNLHVEGEEPVQEFNVQKLLDEILLSHALLFRDDSSFKKLYGIHERKKATVGGVNMFYKI